MPCCSSPLPYEDGDRLVRVWQRLEQAGIERMFFSPQESRDDQGLSSFEDVASYHSATFILAEGNPLEEVQAMVTSARLFDMLREEPVPGRAFRPREHEPGAQPAVLLSEGFWRSRFAADPEILGRRIALRGDEELSPTVVGVVPAGPYFQGWTSGSPGPPPTGTWIKTTGPGTTSW